MNRWSRSSLLAALVAGCGKVPHEVPTAGPTPVPESAPAPEVVRALPVETRPFEEGYEAGYAQGLGAGKPGAKVPPAAAIAEIARAEAGQDAERTERWQRGFVDGYLDAFRKVVTGQK